MDKGDKLIHLGAAYRYAVPDGKTLSYSAKVDNNMCPTLAKTGSLSGVDNVQLAGLEAAGVWGPFTLQGEYIASMANRASSSNEDPAFDGWYVLGSWLITGETRPYDKANAIFKGVKPNSNFGAKEGHGWGAWELSARYQTIDLNKEDIKGGQLNAWTLGLNWYLNKNIKIMADYTLAGTDYPNDSGEQKTRNVGIFGMRFQAAF